MNKDELYGENRIASLITEAILTLDEAVIFNSCIVKKSLNKLRYSLIDSLNELFTENDTEVERKMIL